MQVATTLQENASLETIFIQDSHVTRIEHYILLLTAFQHNSTLKRLVFDYDEIMQLTDDRDKQWPRSSGKTMDWKVLQVLENPRLCDRSAVEVASDVSED
jgi:hypothetical protein